MASPYSPVLKQNLTDELAHRIKQLIRSNGHEPGDRLPSIAEMARRFGVGPPTLREALKKLEAVGMVEIRHGSGVYVTQNEDVLLLSNPVYAGDVTNKLLIDLIEARVAIELQSVVLAAQNATDSHLQEMKRLLKTAGENLENDEVLHSVNMGFHREIALASGNTVLRELLEVLVSLFKKEQRLILDIYGSRDRDHREHLGILDALERKDEALAVERMRSHLEGVREVLLRWG